MSGRGRTLSACLVGDAVTDWVLTVPIPRTGFGLPAITQRTKATTRALILPSPNVTYLPTREATSRITKPAGTREGAVPGARLVPCVSSRSARRRRMTKHSAIMMPVKLTTPSPAEYRFQLLILKVPNRITRTPTHPTDEVTIPMMSPVLATWAGSTPAMPRVMSGVTTAPIMKLLATSAAPCTRLSCGAVQGCVSH